MQSMIVQNLTSPSVLFFALGLAAALFKSDLKFPPALSESLSIYLLAAIGLKGGIELSKHAWSDLAAPITGTLLLGTLIPVAVFAISRWIKLDRKNAAALAATYGSVSIVTFGAAAAYAEQAGMPYESFMSAMVVVLESPAIFISLLILGWLDAKRKKANGKPAYAAGIVATSSQGGAGRLDMRLIKESLLGKSVLLMLGAMAVGLIGGSDAQPVVKPLFVDLYPGVLMLFLLGMGITAGERLAEVKSHGPKLIVLAVAFPLAFGMIGVAVGSWCGLSAGGMLLMGVLGASSSYIAAPAALRHSVPEANPSIYLGMSLGITFPFNLIIGLPVYAKLAVWLAA